MTTIHRPTHHTTLAEAVDEHENRNGRITTSYTDFQWNAIRNLHAAFGLDPTTTRSIALVSGQPLLAMIGLGPSRPDPIDQRRRIVDIAVVEVH